MSKLIVAHTNLGAVYPGYINFTREDDGTVSVIVRGNPSCQVDSFYICGYAKDKGKHGRCTPGDDRCNNYCNMAPEKGPMQNHPAPCARFIEGQTATLTLSAADFASVAAEAADVKRLVKLLALCRDRIESQTNVGVISSDPENEDPQHEFQELLVDLHDALNTGGRDV